MILRRELDDLRGEWSLDIGVIEKDHVLGWLLAGVAQRVDLSKSWVFKGGNLPAQVLLRNLQILRRPRLHRHQRSTGGSRGPPPLSLPT
jgi:hypothetical protein